jgi:drug/metabolite transporter (DMT)-like permease
MKWLLVSITVVATVLSDLLQSYEMKRAGEQSVGARGLARLARLVARRRYLILSIVCLAFSFFAFMALVQREPLSFAVPASAGSFVLEMALAKLALHERLGARRTAGAALVLAGIFLLGQG